MANNYTLFAVEFSFPEQAARDFISLCSTNYPKWFVDNHKRIEEDFDKFIYECDTYGSSANITIDYSDGELYISSKIGGCPAINYVAFLLSEVMKQYNVKVPVVIEYSYGFMTNNSMTITEFGGGVVVIGPGIYKYNSTTSIGEKMAEEMRKEIVR